MKSYKKILALIVLSSLCLATAWASEGEVAVKHKKHHRAERREEKPVCEACEAIRQLKEQIAAQQAEIDQLKASQAQAPAPAAPVFDQKAAEAAAAAQQQAAAAAAAAAEANSKAEAAQADVAGIKASTTGAVQAVEETQKRVSDLEHPAYLHYKNIEFIPGGFLAAESVWRQHAEQTDVLSNSFAKIPTPGSANYDLTEWRGTGRQSRLSFKAIGTIGDVKVLGYYEMDFLGAAPTANENQSNSFNIRQRQLYADAEWHGWGFAGGQMWTLNNLTKKGAAPYEFWNPATIDAQYVAGFTFARQTAFRVYKGFNSGKETVAFSVENGTTIGLPGSTGSTSCDFGGTCTWGGSGTQSYGNGNIYVDNVAPDLIGKVAFDPSFGHFEIRGIGRFFRDRITPPVGSAYNDTEMGWGVGGGAIVPVFHKKLNIIASALAGSGVGRYGDSGVVDVDFNPNGTFSTVNNLQALGGLEWQATPKLMIYGYAGDEYWDRDLHYVDGVLVSGGYGTGSNQRNLVQGVGGAWYDIYKGGYGKLSTGLQYSYTHVAFWGNADAVPPQAAPQAANENMAFTSLRYYLP